MTKIVLFALTMLVSVLLRDAAAMPMSVTFGTTTVSRNEHVDLSVAHA